MINAKAVSLLEQYRNYFPDQITSGKEIDNQEEIKITPYTDRYRPSNITSDQRIEQLEKDREYLLKKNIEFEQNLARIEQEINKFNSIYKPPKKYNNNFTKNELKQSNSIYNRILNTSQQKATPSIQQLNITKNNNNLNLKNKIKQPFHTEHRNIASSLSNISTVISKSVSLNKIPKTVKRSSNKRKGTYICLKEKEVINNRELKQKISQAQNRISQLQEELHYSTLAKKGNNFLRMELTSWKNKTESLGKDMYDELNKLKQTLFDDKKNFCDNVLNMKKECNVYLSTIKEKFQTTIEKQELLIEMYTEQNDKVKKRLHKIRSIFY